MDSAISKQLVDKMYEKRKAAALDLEKQVRDCHQQGDERRISQIIDQLVEMFSNPSNPLHVRNGGLIGLAGTAIAMGVHIAPYMDKFVEPLLVCFTDPENRVRYFSAECLYNVAKVSKGEILVYFNPIFDALSKLAADSELSVKNGAELLDRLLKDIVAESASVYVPQYAETEKISKEADEGVLVPHPVDGPGGYPGARKAFSLARFIPLLKERIYVISPFTRSFLVSWITVLDSVPELELVTYLPEFLDGLLKYLSDPTEDVKIQTENVLADFLREIRDVTLVRKRNEEQARLKQKADAAESKSQNDGEKNSSSDITPTHTEKAMFISEREDSIAGYDSDEATKEDLGSTSELRDTGAWIPGQGVKIDYAAIVDILISQLDGDHDEIQQSTALRWLAEFLNFAQEVIVPFTPRLIPAILPNLAHHVPMIQSAANRTNQLLQKVIQNLPTPDTDAHPAPAERFTSTRPVPSSPTPLAMSPPPTRHSSVGKDPSVPEMTPVDNASDGSGPSLQSERLTTKSRTNTQQSEISALNPVGPSQLELNRPHSPSISMSPTQLSPSDPDPFDYQATVNALTIQFLSEHEETRVAAMKWLIMLHQKAPNKLLTMDDGTFPALLKTLSDSSEEVIKHDLQLIAQISSTSEESYFKSFMINLLELFSTDRRLLDARGSLIIRQLCVNLSSERIYRTFAEVLEKEDDLEFASDIVQKLNIILITAPELADFRRRLKSLETRQDGQALFITLYRSWCHNAVAVFSLCLLAQAYEHASNLLQIFADLEITVQLLVQIDKLVQLIESPVFTYLRLQLLEPERYPHLFKCLYGLLMLLPQSSAFISLRNRLMAVNSIGFLHIPNKPSAAAFSSRSKIINRDEIKWQELLSHFRSVQARHEKARRQAVGSDAPSFPAFQAGDKPSGASSSSQQGSTTRPPVRRRVTGEVPPSPPPPARGGGSILSPLNPRARGANGLLSSALTSSSARPASPTALLQQGQSKAKRTLSLSRKT
ncbi:ARM repeat-containing protein [Gloeophyllum trabeum ATCC 11539]|uniref:ARM repeat-containing protein n=1 Tax=Gloeophyllum trabeum (strain ATCC 11539 / FP-39264 / Madison 617) TaxID=670483 RepID=S7S0C8_GLOTA|nr:ARM repeat-containing protein [Gloeophyllum trabeum ATCC 11539]EPQ59169.1 ARM repeat-containing protein [Gloeophyllum trabeum ATCC 11539]